MLTNRFVVAALLIAALLVTLASIGTAVSALLGLPLFCADIFTSWPFRYRLLGYFLCFILIPVTSIILAAAAKAYLLPRNMPWSDAMERETTRAIGPKSSWRFWIDLNGNFR